MRTHTRELTRLIRHRAAVALAAAVGVGVLTMTGVAAIVGTPALAESGGAITGCSGLSGTVASDFLKTFRVAGAEVLLLNGPIIADQTQTDDLGEFCVGTGLEGDYRLEVRLIDARTGFSLNVEDSPPGPKTPWDGTPPAMSPIEFSIDVDSDDWSAAVDVLMTPGLADADVCLCKARDIDTNLHEANLLTRAATTYALSTAYLDWLVDDLEIVTDGAFAAAPGRGLFENVRTGEGVASFYDSSDRLAYLEAGISADILWHELTHYVTDLDLINANGDSTDPDAEGHAGVLNDSTADSVVEGIAQYLPALFGTTGFDDNSPDGAYGAFGPLEQNSFKSWSTDPDGTNQREDLAFAALVWDLVDGSPDPSSGDDLAACVPASCDDTTLKVTDTEGPWEIVLTDRVALRAATVYDAIAGLSLVDTTVAGLREALIDDPATPAGLLAPTVDLLGNGDHMVTPLDVPFLMHGFFPCPNGTPCVYDMDAGQIGETDRPYSGVVQLRRIERVNPAAAIRLVNGEDTPQTIAVSYLEETVVRVVDIALGANETRVIPFELPPYYPFALEDGVEPPTCETVNDARQILVDIDDGLGGHLDFDACELAARIEQSDGAPVFNYLVGDASLRIQVEFVDAAQAGDTGVLTIDPGQPGSISFDDLEAAIANIDPSLVGTSLAVNTTLKLYVPALDAISPVKVPGAVIELNATGSTVDGLTAFGAHISGQILFGDEVLDFDTTFDFADASGDQIESIVLDLGLTNLDGDSVIDSTELVRLLEGLTGAGYTVPASVIPDATLQSVAVHAALGGDGTVAIDVEAAATIGEVNTAVLFSVDKLPGESPRLLVGAKFDNATDPTAETINLSTFLGGGLGELATDLELPAFSLVTAIPAPADGEPPLTYDQLRTEQQKFFEPRGLPTDLNIAGTLSIASSVNLDAVDDDDAEIFGDVKDLFGIPDGETVDLFGELGFSLGDLVAGGFGVDSVRLQLDLPTAGLGSTDIFPEWLTFPDGASLTLDYDDGPPAELALGMEADVRIGLYGGDVPGHVSGRLSTSSGRIDATLRATLTTDWVNPFGQDWVRVVAGDDTFLSFEIGVGSGDDLTVSAALSAAALIGPGVDTDPGAAVAETTVSAEIDVVGGEPSIRVDVELADLQVIAALEAVGLDAATYGLDALGEFTINGSALVEIGPSTANPGSTKAVFAVQGTVSIEALGGIEAGVLFSTTLDGSTDTGLVAGVKLQGPGGQSLMLSDLLNGLPFDAELPAVGFVFSSRALHGDHSVLNDVEFDFIKTLFGCDASSVRPGDPGAGPVCDNIELDIDPGSLVFLSNLPLPGATAPGEEPGDDPAAQIADALAKFGVDVSDGVQIVGTLPISADSPPEISLSISLPQVTNADGELPDWIDSAKLSLTIEGSTSGVTLGVTGGLDLRLRQTPEPIADATECEALLGELGYGYNDEGTTKVTYCFAIIKLSATLELSASASGISITGRLELGDDNYTWEQPFGIEWLAINHLVLELGVTIPPTGTPTINLGLLADLRIGEKDLFGSVAFGIRVLPATPFVAPNFEGIRVRSDAGIELNDLYLIHKTIAELAGDDLPDHVTDLGLPNPALKNLDFGFALVEKPSLCLSPGIIISADFYPSYEEPEERDPDDPLPPDPNSGGCRPVGPVPGSVPCGLRDDGCFAGVFASVSLEGGGLFALGSLAPFDLGPLHWDGGLVDLTLTLAEQRFVVDGGVGIDGLGSGEVSVLMQGLPVPLAEFYGEITVAGGFEAQVSGSAGITLTPEAPAPPFPPVLDGEITFNVALKNDLEEQIRGDLAAALRQLSNAVEDAENAFNDFEDDPLGALADTVDALEAAGVDVPDWATEILDQLKDVPEADWPSLSEVLSGEPIELPYPAFPRCPAGTDFVWLTLNCQPGDIAAEWYCPTGGTPNLFNVCSLSLDFSGLVPDDVTDLVGDMEVAFEEVTEKIALVPDGFSLSKMFEQLAGQFEGPNFLSVDCVSFEITLGAGTSTEPQAEVGAVIVLTVNGTPYEIGFTLNLLAIDVTVLAEDLVGGLLGGFGPPPSTCTEEVDPPSWTEVVAPQSVAVSVDPSVVDEGDAVELTGVFAEVPEGVENVTIDWGDGTSETIATSALSFTRFHTYVDDDPTQTAEDTYVIQVALAGGDGDSTVVTVANVAPTVDVTLASVIDEGAAITMDLSVTDPGTDELAVTVDWGDGTIDTPSLDPGGDAVLTHVWVDDDPTDTPQDIRTVRVRVDDDDLGTTLTTHKVTVRNVDPAITAATLTAFENTNVTENVSATFTVDFVDPGTDDHLVTVAWGDGTSDSRYVPAAAADTATFQHTWADDDPSGTSSDPYTATVTVLDDDRGSDTESPVVTVRNADPVVDPVTAPATVQYSDPMDDVTIVVRDVVGDPLTAATTWSVDGSGPTGGLPGSWQLATGSCDIDVATNVRTCEWTIGGTTDIGPGEYSLGVTVSDDDLGSTVIDIPVTVLPEDARAYYVGPVFAATTDARDDTAVIELRATIQDITLAVGDPAWDPYPGDILNATVRFVDREAGNATLCTATTGYIFADEIGLATAWCDWEADIGRSDAKSFVIGVVVEGWYTHNDTADDTVVTVARPIDNFITGGGFLDLVDSQGIYAGDTGTHANFGFNVKFNRRLTNLQGHVTVIVRSDGHTYRIKTNSLRSLGVVEVDGDGVGIAEFEAKANIVDVTDQDDPISLGGNLTFQMRMTDNGEPGETDSIGFSLWDKDGELLFSSNWDDVETIEQELTGGNLVVHR